MFADGTWIFLLEALLALTLAVLIVWWTLPRKTRERDHAEKRRDAGSPQDPSQR